LVTHFDPDWVAAPLTIAERLGIEEETYLVLWPRFRTAGLTGEIGSYEDVLLQLCQTAGVEPDVELIGQLVAERGEVAKRTFASIDPEILTMLDSLKGSRLRLGVVTNAGDVDTAPWTGSRPAGYFDDFVASHEVGLMKPDANIFLLACDRLEVKPAETVFVGDGGSNELFGASQAGLFPYWCTWYLDRWPADINPNGFEGDEWRRRRFGGEPPYRRVRRPAELVEVLIPKCQ
jgi:putative hydrolase of the HAD superfamily